MNPKSSGNNNQNINWSGTAADENYLGTVDDDLLDGGAGDDTISALEGNDTLIGGLGADALDGGDGDDTYFIDATDTLTDKSGTDNVFADFTYTLLNGFENLRLTGSAALDGTGNSVSNVIFGNAGDNALYGLGQNDTIKGGNGDDTLDGGTGNDMLWGGFGNDTYYVDSSSDETIEESPYGGIDTVYSTVTYALSVNTEKLTLKGADDINGSGNGIANIVTGNSGNNRLHGMTGNDILKGGAGNDTLWGDAGNDTLSGGSGNDLFVFKVGFGKDLIQDFNAAHDRIDIRTLSEVTSFADLKSHHLEAKNGDVLIHIGAQQMTLDNLKIADLHKEDFLI